MISTGNIVNVVTCALVVIFSFVTDAHPMKREVSGRDNPCSLLLAEGNNVGVPLLSTTKDLITRTEGILHATTAIKQSIAQKLNGFNLSELDTQHFMDTEKMLINDENKAATVSYPIASLLSHYRLLYELAAYFEKVRTAGEIGTLISEANLREQVEDTELKIYSAICTVKIGLLSANQDTVTKTESVSAVFLAAGQNYTTEMLRAYLVMGDSEKLMTYLNQMYLEVEKSLQ